MEIEEFPVCVIFFGQKKSRCGQGMLQLFNNSPAGGHLKKEKLYTFSSAPLKIDFYKLSDLHFV